MMESYSILNYSLQRYGDFVTRQMKSNKNIDNIICLGSVNNESLSGLTINNKRALMVENATFINICKHISNDVGNYDMFLNQIAVKLEVILCKNGIKCTITKVFIEEYNVEKNIIIFEYYTDVISQIDKSSFLNELLPMYDSLYMGLYINGIIALSCDYIVHTVYMKNVKLTESVYSTCTKYAGKKIYSHDGTTFITINNHYVEHCIKTIGLEDTAKYLSKLFDDYNIVVFPCNILGFPAIRYDIRI